MKKIVGLFLLLRLAAILVFPPFADETAYLYWTEKMLTLGDLSQPLRDGTGPVFMILTSPFILMTGNFLLSGRLTSLFAEVISLIVLGFLTFRLTRSQKALLATLLFAMFNPLTFLQGRLAILDPLVTMWSLLAIFMAVSLLRTSNLFLKSLVLGIFLALGFLTKPIILTIIPLLFPLPYIFEQSLPRRKKILKAIIVSVVYAGFLIILTFAPFQKEFFFLYRHYHKNLTDPHYQVLTTSIYSIYRQIRWLEIYFSFPVFVTLVLSSIVFFRHTVVRLALLWIIIVIGMNALVGTANIFPRHLFQMLPGVALLFGFSLNEMWKNHPRIALLLYSLVLIIFIYKDISLSLSPQKITIPKEDRLQLFEDWTSGYGLADTAQEVQRLQDHKTKIVVDDQWLAHSLHLFYGLSKETFEIREDLFFRPLPNSLEAFGDSYYLIFNRQYNPLSEWNLEKIWSYATPPRKPITIYKRL